MKSRAILHVGALVVMCLAMAEAAVYAASGSGGATAGRSQNIIVEPGTPPPPPPPAPPVDYGFDVDVWTDQRAYNPGDLIRINFRATRPCYVYIFDTDTRGVTHQIFPNYFDADNLVFPGRRYFIPDSKYRLRVTGPPGTEQLRIVAVRYRAVGFEKQHRFNAQDPFPTYSEGSAGFMRSYQKLEKGPAAPATPPPPPKTVKSAPGTGPSTAEVTQEPAAPGRSEAIVGEATAGPKAIVVEPNPPTRPTYDRDTVEADWAFEVVEPSVEPTPPPPPPEPVPYEPPVSAPVYGMMRVTSAPSGARVVVDGTLIGYTPVVLQTLDPGVHSVEISMRGFYSFSQNIQVNVGRTTVVNVRLQPVSRVRWGFGIGY